MKVIAQVLRVRPGCRDEYKRRHDELWPELASLLARLGIQTTIFAFEDLLFAYASAPDERAWDEAARDPVTRRWEAYMAEVLETDERGLPRVVDLPVVFSFGNTPG